MALVEFVGGYLADKTVGYFCDLFKANVIERWTKRRAESFVTAFCDAISRNVPKAELQSYIDAVLVDEANSEALFDAYRRVALSASPVVGPRMIAILTARLVSANRAASEDEERMLSAAEILNDRELAETVELYESYISSLPKQHLAFAAYGRKGESTDAGLWDFGSHGAKLGQLGFITRNSRIEVPKIHYHDGTESGDAEFYMDTFFDPAFPSLCELIESAMPEDAEQMER